MKLMLRLAHISIDVAHISIDVKCVVFITSFMKSSVVIDAYAGLM